MIFSASPPGFPDDSAERMEIRLNKNYFILMVRYKYWANNKVLTPIHVNSVLCVFVSIIPVATLANDILIHFRVSRILQIWY